MDERENPPGQQGDEEGTLWLNIGRLVLLIGILVAAWFLLEWLFGGK